jgi:hypothetical protein
MAGDQATSLKSMACVVEQWCSVGVAERPTSSEQNRLRRRHVPVLRRTLARKREIKIGFAAQDGGHLATDTAYGPGGAELQGLEQRFSALISGVPAGHQHQFCAITAGAETGGEAFPGSVLTPGLTQPGGLWSSQQAEPKLLRFR